MNVPVLIVGGGPAGLTASLLLSAHGVPSLLVERRTTASPLPRARGVHARAMEILRTCGAEQAVRARQLEIDPGAEWRETLPAAALREHRTGGPELAKVSPCEGAAISQDVFEEVLRAEAAARPGAVLRFGTELLAFTTSPDGVRAELAGGVAVRARYMIAADGVRSGVREALGVALHGDDDLGRMRAVAFRADLTPWTGPVPRGLYFLTGVGGVLLPTHPDGRWVANGPERPGAAADLVRSLLGIPDLDLDVITEGAWTAVARSAERMAAGPVFLVGDAAHQVPPAGATGISSAMADVHNLAWKLAAVLGGRAGEELLDTYAAEREPVVAVAVAEAREGWKASLDPSGRPFSGRTLRQLDMGYRYASPAVVPDGSPDRSGPGDYAPVGDPGCRAPHLWIDGGTRSTLDLFGRDLVLLTAPGGAEWRAAALDGVVARCITEPAWPARYGVGSAGAVLVRPDGHVAWRSRSLVPNPGPALRAAAATALATPPHGRNSRTNSGDGSAVRTRG